MNASIEKAVAPLIVAGIAALTALLTGGPVDITAVQGALVTAAAGLVTFGLVYFVRYNERTPNKALAALLPLVVAAVHAWQTGEVNSPEVLLGVQGLIGAAWTYVASRKESPVEAERVEKLKRPTRR